MFEISDADTINEKTSFSVRGIDCNINYCVYPARTPSPTPVNLLLMHGHSSDLHELDDVLEYLDTCNIFVFDQSNNGRSKDVDWQKVSPHYTEEVEGKAPVLYFLRDVTARFISQIIGENTPLRIAGGSLGANIALLLAERTPALPHLKDIVVWSPGSAWRADFATDLARNIAKGRGDRIWTDSASDCDDFLRTTFCEKVALGEVTAPGIYPQPWYWYWDRWGPDPYDKFPNLRVDPATEFCTTQAYPPMSARKARHIEKAFHKLRDEYVGSRARWHWRVAYEEIAVSHHLLVHELKCKVQFLAGAYDNVWPVDLRSATSALCDKAKEECADLGLAFNVIEGSGHSLHNEAPVALANYLRRPL